MKCSYLLVIICMLGSVAGTPAMAEPDTDIETAVTETTAEPRTKQNKKPKDPARGRFLPIPIFITEPAIGEGLGIALAYFHRTKDLPEGRSLASPESLGSVSREQAPPPTVTGIFGAYTSNETAAAGIGHMNTFRGDRIRFTGVAALADVKSTIYVTSLPVDFNLKGTFLFQDTKFRIAASKWFLGVGFSYLDADNTFELTSEELPPLEPFIDFSIRNVGLAAKLAWDTRDNTNQPNRGQLFDLALWRYDRAIGGNYDYWDARLKMLSFHPIGKKFVTGFRFEYATIDGRTPFFGIPWVSLRGIPALRYQGEHVAVAEIEGRYKLAPKWSLVGFAGLGWTRARIPGLDTNDDIYAFGIGARYRIFDAQNVWVGIDIARGTEETNWYVRVGHAW